MTKSSSPSRLDAFFGNPAAAVGMAVVCNVLWGSAFPFIKMGYRLFAIDATDIKDFGKKSRGVSNLITFMSNKYNANGVHTTTPKADQYIFMDAMFNADYDVEVLASAFNMDKAEYQGKLKLIDDFGTFDNERFNVIRANSDMIEEVTAEELAICSKVKAVLVDKEWFQVYDNLTKFTEDYVASGMYWNYFYNVWKTVSYSPFSNAIVLVDNTAETALPATFTAKIADKSVSEAGTVLMGKDEKKRNFYTAA